MNLGAPEMLLCCRTSAYTFLCTEDRPPSGERRGHLSVQCSTGEILVGSSLHSDKLMLEYLESDAAKTLPKHLEGTANMLG